MIVNKYLLCYKRHSPLLLLLGFYGTEGMRRQSVGHSQRIGVLNHTR